MAYARSSGYDAKEVVLFVNFVIKVTFECGRRDEVDPVSDGKMLLNNFRIIHGIPWQEKDIKYIREGDLLLLIFEKYGCRRPLMR